VSSPGSFVKVIVDMPEGWAYWRSRAEYTCGHTTCSSSLLGGFPDQPEAQRLMDALYRDTTCYECARLDGIFAAMASETL
jgi:hypothetical protein